MTDPAKKCYNKAYKRKGLHTMFDTLFNGYTSTSAADAYILGFEDSGKVYELIINHLPVWLLKLDRESTSHGGALKLRIAMTAKNKARLKAAGAAYIGTVSEILNGRKNAGEAFEKYETEKAGQEWKKDSVPYYIDGDLTVNDKKYQIKFGNASLANENTIKKAMARG